MSIEAKCHFCADCDGRGCLDEIPGMGGVRGNENFIQNRRAWQDYRFGEADDTCPLPAIRLAPITGAVQNVGWTTEEPFYRELIRSAKLAGIGLSIGDGCPDEKLRFGIAALEAEDRSGAVFIKPYENRKILERIEWARPVAELIGVDIDSWNIPTMRNLAKLERKNAAQLLEIKRSLSVPFCIKGIFLEEDLDLVRAVRPDIVVISNHGGRVSTRSGSTAEFLDRFGKELALHTGKIWVDGGIRDRHDLAVAKALGASEVMIGRPFIQALIRGGQQGIALRLQEFLAVPVLEAVPL